MAKRNLLLGFDAFGTLFRIKQPIERQYGDVARHQFPGLLRADIGDTQLRASFRDAFKAQSRAHPNYGHKPNGEGMGATVWWTQVIHKTFQPLLGKGQIMPPELAPQLLARFASSKGYSMSPKLPELLKRIKKDGATPYGRVVVGVITNSDDRVPDILSSFGVRVSPLRYGQAVPKETTASQKQTDNDIDFLCMSYDAGVEKPDPAIFRAAESLLPAVMGTRTDLDMDTNMDNWDKVYVGDEASKDVVGAHAAGWYPVLLTGEEKAEDAVLDNKTVPHLDDNDSKLFSKLFGPPEDKAVFYTEDVVTFLKWL
ncbi:hypothetical protein SBRCBS47491_002166 [Sporothrix bragantina]|uniref:Haloacid dehalogenase n=1 Tax=Sporothrix bragantina TaxID=671064 RepID=A0ABP0B4R1_9PEZI